MSRILEIAVERGPDPTVSAAETAVRVARRVAEAAPDARSAIGAIVLCHATVDASVLESGSTAVRLQHELQLKSCFPFSIGQQPGTGVFHAIDVALGLMAAEKLGAVLVVCVDRWPEGVETGAPHLGPTCDDAAALMLSREGLRGPEVLACGNVSLADGTNPGAVADAVVALVAPALADRGFRWADVGHVVSAAPVGGFTEAVHAALPLVQASAHGGPGLGSAGPLVALAGRLDADASGRSLTLLWATGPQGQVGALVLLPHGPGSEA